MLVLAMLAASCICTCRHRNCCMSVKLFQSPICKQGMQTCATDVLRLHAYYIQSGAQRVELYESNMSIDTAFRGLNSDTEYLMQGLKMTDGLHSLTVCNHTFVDVRNTYPYRSYELLTVQVRFPNERLACQRLYLPSLCIMQTSQIRCRIGYSLLCHSQHF